MRIILRNPLKRRATNVYFDKLAIGFSFFGVYKFAFMRSIDIVKMRKQEGYSDYGLNDAIYNKFGKGYSEQGWGVVWHTKN